MARDFNGSSQYITPAAELDISGTAITISAWVYIDTLTTDKMIVCKGDANAYNYNYFLSITNLGWLPNSGYVVFGYINGSLQHAAEGATLLSTGVWYHLLGVYNGATQKIFINAVEDASIAETGSMTQNNYAVKIGASPNISGHSMYHDGRIAEVGIWNAALNADEIKALKNGISPAFIRGESLLAYYPLTGQDSPEPDLKAGNNGTVTGATAIEHVPITYPPALINEWAKISASGVTVAPTPADAKADTVAPTTVLGSLTLAPTASTAAAASVAPTTVLGSLSITPNPAAAAAASIAPTVVLGSVTVTPAVRTAAGVSVAPTVVQSSMTIAPTADAAAAAAVNPTVVLGSISITPTADTAAAASIAPTVVLGSITVAPTARTAAAAAIAPTVVLGSLSITPSPSAAAAASVAPTVSAGGNLTIAPAPASAAGSSVAPTVVLGSITVAPTARTAAGASVAPTVVLGSLTIAPAARTAAASSIAPTTVFGSLSITPNPATAAAASVAPTVLSGGGVTVTPTARTAAADSVAPTVVLGSLAITPAARTAAAVAVDPALVFGSITIVPPAASIAAASVTPAINNGGDQFIVPFPASAKSTSVSPTAVFGSLALAPVARTAAAASVNPTVVLGSLALAPTPANAKAATVAPTVVSPNSIVVTPAARSAAAASVNPTVLLGNLAVAPAPASAKTDVGAPILVFGSVIVVPAAASAKAATVAPTLTSLDIALIPAPASAKAGTVAPITLAGNLAITPSYAFARAGSKIGKIRGGEPIVVPDYTADCAPRGDIPTTHTAFGALFARIDTVDVPVTKASVTWKLGAVAEFSVSVPARSISRQQAHFADIALWEGSTKIISGIISETPQIELDYQGVSQLSLRCIDEVGRLTATRAILTKHVQDEWVPQAVTDILRVAGWELHSYATMLNGAARVTVDLRNKDTLFAQIAELIKSVPKTLLRYAGVNPINGKHMLDIGYFNRNQYHLIQGDNLLSLKVQHNTNPLVRVLEAYSDALPERRITLQDALKYPTIATEPDFVNYPITFDAARGTYVMTNGNLTRGRDVAKSFSMHRTKNDGVPSDPEIAAAGFSVWQRGVRFLQQCDDYVSATATGLFEQIPLAGDKIFVRGRATERIWDSAARIYREEETFALAEWMRITQVNYEFDHVTKPGYTYGNPINLYRCTLELTSAEYPEEFDDAQQIVESVQTFKQLDSSNAIKSSGALVYVPVSVTALATDPADAVCGGTGKQFSFAVPTPPAGSTNVSAVIISASEPSANYSVVQQAAMPNTPLIVCATVAGSWGSANLTLTAQFTFS